MPSRFDRSIVHDLARARDLRNETLAGLLRSLLALPRRRSEGARPAAVPQGVAYPRR